MIVHEDLLLRTALRAVGEAMAAARRVQADITRVQQLTKDDRSPVTVADYAVQAIVALELAAQLEDVRVVGEEESAHLRDDDNAAIRDAVIDAVHTAIPSVDRHSVLDAIDLCDHDGSADSYWTLDPVDGTKGFLRGQQYAISLAWIEDGRVMLGVLGCPNLSIDQSRPFDEADGHGTVYAAAAGAGTWEFRGDDLHGSPNRIKILPRAEDAPVRVCGSVEAAHSSKGDTGRVIEHLGIATEPARLDSQCKYAVVARGQADAYLRMPTRADYREKIWDHAAGMLIALEAGAEVTDIHGKRLDFTHGQQLEANRGVICATPDLHGRIITAIRDLGIGADRT